MVSLCNGAYPSFSFIISTNRFSPNNTDIGFNLGRMGVFSKAFKNATMKRYFRVEFKVSKQGRNKRRISFFLVGTISDSIIFLDQLHLISM